jgi:hypothetical protein
VRQIPQICIARSNATGYSMSCHKRTNITLSSGRHPSHGLERLTWAMTTGQASQTIALICHHGSRLPWRRRRIYWSSPAMLICSPLMTAVTPIMATVLVMFHRFRSSSQDPWIDLVVPRVGLTRTAVTQSKSKGITNTAPYHSKLTVQNHVWR